MSDSRLPRFSVELTPDVLHRFTAAFPRGTPSHLVRWFIEAALEMRETAEGMVILNNIIYSAKPLDRQAALADIYNHKVNHGK